MEICVVRQNGSETMQEEDVGEIVALIKKEREEAEKAKKAKNQ